MNLLTLVKQRGVLRNNANLEYVIKEITLFAKKNQIRFRRQKYSYVQNRLTFIEGNSINVAHYTHLI